MTVKEPYHADHKSVSLRVGENVYTKKSVPHQLNGLSPKQAKTGIVTASIAISIGTLLIVLFSVGVLYYAKQKRYL